MLSLVASTSVVLQGLQRNRAVRDALHSGLLDAYSPTPNSLLVRHGVRAGAFALPVSVYTALRPQAPRCAVVHETHELYGIEHCPAQRRSGRTKSLLCGRQADCGVHRNAGLLEDSVVEDPKVPENTPTQSFAHVSTRTQSQPTDEHNKMRKVRTEGRRRST